MNGVGKTGMNDDRDPISIWRVYLPLEIGRDVYIRNCYLSGTITLINENGEIISNVKVGKLALQQIDFPIDEKEQGSEVACVKSPYSSQLYVIEVYHTNSQYSSQDENQYRFYKTNGIGTAGILIDGNGNIILTVDGDTGQGNITIAVTNKDRAGNLNLIVNGNVLLENDGDTTIKSKKIQLNESTEPILLGTKTVQLISDLLDILGSESAGPYPLLHQTDYLNLKNNLEALKSTLSFVK